MQIEVDKSTLEEQSAWYDAMVHREVIVIATRQGITYPAAHDVWVKERLKALTTIDNALKGRKEKVT